MGYALAMALAYEPESTPPQMTTELVTNQGDERVLLTGVAWGDYVTMRDLLDGPRPKMTFLNGQLELMSPSPAHEYWKTNIARLVELYAYIGGIDLRGYGSATFKLEMGLRGAEPDECYLVGKQLDRFPEIVIEVVHSTPLLNKLEVYAGMGVAEVWVYAAGVFTVNLFDGRRYIASARSRLVPGLDFELLARYVPRTDGIVALREYESKVRESSSP